MKLQSTPGARSQLLAAIAYIRFDDPGAARAFRERAESALRELKSFPDLGRQIPEFPELPHRELIVRPYRFFYRVAGSTIWIIGVWHGRRRPAKPN